MRLILLTLWILLVGCHTTSPAKQDQNQLVNTYVQLSTAYLEQDRTNLALQRASRAIVLMPENVQANYVYGLAQQQNKNYISASKFFKKSLDLSKGKYLEAQNAYAVSLCQQGQTAKAHRLLKELIKNQNYATPNLARDNLKKCYV